MQKAREERDVKDNVSETIRLVRGNRLSVPKPEEPQDYAN